MRLKWDQNERGTVLNEPTVNGTENSINKVEAKEAKMNPETDKSENDVQKNWETQDLNKEKSKNNNETPKSKSKISVYKGVFYSSLSSVFFSLCSVIVKYLKVNFRLIIIFFPKCSIFKFTLLYSNDLE